MHTMHILFLFVDGVGLGPDDPASNPFAVARLPPLASLTGGRALLAGLPRLEGERATFIPTGAALGVPGLPQSASGQAAILTGRNVPAEIGRHYGPKPDAHIAEIIERSSVFKRLVEAGRTAALLNAYPERYFAAIRSGRRSYSAIPLAVTAAGLPLFTAADLLAGRALSADFTGEGWRSALGYASAPVYTLPGAGARMAELARQRDFSFFEHWPTDYAGHRGTLAEATTLLERFDAVLGGLLAAWHDRDGLIVITSDHGNIEQIGDRRHTANQVPTLVIGAPATRRAFTAGLTDLTGLAPAILRALAPGRA
ncbi:MAG: hypothetical protein HY784_18375 [Chloroflexi bacterium]|nr:hypothetical protein [Chloroflexota bacterium]